MTFLSKVFEPGRNRRLNELIGLVLCVSALLLFLAFLGIGSFLLPVFLAMLGARWFRSRAVQSPIAKTLGGIWLLMFVPALLAILPGEFRWMGAIPIEGLVGRILGDVLIRYLNVAGAYIVCTTVLAVALYLTTAFSFSALQVWAPTRFAFFLALRDRWRDWRDERARKRQQKEVERRRAEKPMVTAQLVPARANVPRPEAQEKIAPLAMPKTARRTGIERMAEDEQSAFASASETSTPVESSALY